MSIESLTELLGWSFLINTFILLLTTAAVVSLREKVVKIHSRMFGVSEADLTKAYFHYLANYKLLILVLNLAPYLALKIMS